MSRWVNVIIAGGMLLVTGGVVVSLLMSGRGKSERASSQNNLREIAAFAVWHHAMPGQPLPPEQKVRFPVGTIVNPDLTPDQRLSWFVTLLPALDHRKLAPSSIGPAIDLAKAWDVEPNRTLGAQRIKVFVSPSRLPADPAFTNYVGNAGLGIDAATLPADSPRGGIFRYDVGLTVDMVKDGLSHTIMVAETNDQLGPWIRGGPSTVRGLDEKRRPYIGDGAPYGGVLPDGANFAYADGSVRFLVNGTSAAVLRSQLTASGEGVDDPAGE